MLKNYLQVFPNYFWRWEENTEVIAIPEGSTIVYKSQLAEIIHELAPQGLPSLGSMLLAIMATNTNGIQDFEKVEKIINLHVKNTISPTTIHEVKTLLTLIANLPAKYKKGDRKKLILKAIFKDCHKALSLKKSAILHAKFKSLTPVFLESCRVPQNQAKCLNDFRTVALLNRRFNNTESIIHAITNIPTLKEEIILEEEILEESKDFVESLLADEKTYKVGALVKIIWSGLQLPHQNTAPSTQALGGVSDLTNKGNFDNLLISEYANDDLLFLLRLANNDALYLRREAPPTTNDKKRILLIDVSLKNWGKPKILNFATMLAIAKHPKNKIDYDVFLVGKSFYPVQVETVDDIIDAFQIVDSSLSCVEGIKAFFDSEVVSSSNEIFVFTEKSSAKSKEMTQLQIDLGNKVNYWIHSDVGGNIDVYKKLKNSMKHLQSFSLPLEELWKRRKIFKRKINYNLKNHGASDYPILFKPPQSVMGITTDDKENTYLLTKEKALLKKYHYTSKKIKKGWELIIEKIPIKNTDFEIGITKTGETILLLFNREDKEITLLNLNTKEEKKFFFSEWSSTQGLPFLFYKGTFYYKNTWKAYKINLSGEISSSDLTFAAIEKHFNEKQEKIKQFHRLTYSFGVLKNIKTVTINAQGNLMFNSHQLSFSGSHFTIDIVRKPSPIHQAELIGQNCFIFKDGSQITLNKTGMLLLESKNKYIPRIYVPSVLNGAVGLATSNIFSGNTYYYKQAKFDLSLKSLGEGAALSAVKLVKELTSIGLRDAKILVDSIPHRLDLVLTKTEVDIIQLRFSNINVETEIISLNQENQEMKIIPQHEFNHKFLSKFIENIQKHGA